MKNVPHVTSGLEWADELARRLTEFHEHWRVHRPKAASLEPAPQDLQILIANLIMEVQREVRCLDPKELQALYDALPKFRELKEELRKMTSARDRLGEICTSQSKQLGIRNKAAKLLTEMEG